MNTPMSDNEFLNYCDTHSHSERCGFVPEHIARLASLAGKDEIAEAWSNKPLNIHNMDGYDIREFVELARHRLASTPAPSA